MLRAPDFLPNIGHFDSLVSGGVRPRSWLSIIQACARLLKDERFHCEPSRI